MLKATVLGLRSRIGNLECHLLWTCPFVRGVLAIVAVLVFSLGTWTSPSAIAWLARALVNQKSGASVVGLGLTYHALVRCNLTVLHLLGFCSRAFGEVSMKTRLALGEFCQRDKHSATESPRSSKSKTTRVLPLRSALTLRAPDREACMELGRRVLQEFQEDRDARSTELTNSV